jgi:hypothetical protein
MVLFSLSENIPNCDNIAHDCARPYPSTSVISHLTKDSEVDISFQSSSHVPISKCMKILSMVVEVGRQTDRRRDKTEGNRLTVLQFVCFERTKFPDKYT